MGARLGIERGSSNHPPATSGGKRRNKRRQIHPAVAVFAARYADRVKPAAILEDMTGASRSFCEKVLDGRSAPGADMIEALIFSEIGREVLKAMAAAREARPSWWGALRRQLDAGAIRSEIRQLQQRLEALDEEGDA